MSPLRLVALLTLSASLLTACGRGDARTGEPCSRDEDCAHGLCVEGAGGPHALCTVSCASERDCPEGWSCSGVTQANVLICTRGNATPFGR